MESLQYEGVELFKGKPPFYLRGGSTDRYYIEEYFLGNWISLPLKLKPELIFDIGAGTGLSTVLIREHYRGATIYSFEPDKNCFELLKLNTERYQNIHLFNTSVNSKKDDSTLKLSDVLNRTKSPDLIVIDVEGNEYDILCGLKHIEKVKYITGKLYGNRTFAILDYLSKWFYIEYSTFFRSKVTKFSAVSKPLLDQWYSANNLD